MKRQVVVVDDLDSVRALVRATLADDERFDVVGEAADGEAAVEVVARLAPDLVVLDLAMPGVDGLTALGRLTSEHPEVAVVVYSELLGQRASVLAAGAKAFVAKSDPISTLVDALGTAIDAHPLVRLGAAEQTYRFLEALPVGVAVVEQGRMAFLNQIGRRILGTGSHDVLPAVNIVEHFQLRRESTGELYPIEELPIVRALFYGESSTADDVIVDRPDGQVHVETYAAPVEGGDDSRQYAVVAFTDVSERHAQQVELSRALSSLSAANEALMEFAAVAAHDLAAPLRTVSGFAQLLEERYGSALPAEARGWVGYMLSETERMREFIEELLAYARAGAPTDTVSDVSLGEVARRVVAELGPEIDRTGATVGVGDLPVVAGDEARLAQVLQNLLTNALKFRADDRPLRVGVDAELDGDDWIVSVTDNGLGVPEDERPKIFVPFSRGSAGESQTGHGLGLTICRRVVERHGGRLWVEPTPGGGSRFRFSLPDVRGAAPSPRTAS